MDTRQSREIGQKAAKNSNRRGYVYFIEAVGDPNRRHKIGRTTKPKERFNTLKNQSPYQHQVLQCIECSDCVATEKELHNYFAEFRVQGTEWFELTPSEVDRVIQLMQAFDANLKKLRVVAVLLSAILISLLMILMKIPFLILLLPY